jgi:lincosamide nucleotidyltransferase A/C/D/E
MTSRKGAQRAARAIHRFVKSHRILWVPAGWVSRTVAGAPERSPLRSVLGPLRDGLRGAMASEDVLAVVDALASAAVPFYLAGGWGVDALVGRQSRSHDDLDVVIDDYDHDLARAVDALKPLGYELVATYERRAWMPKNTVLEDDTGRGVDLDSLNWELLAREFGPPASEAADRASFEHRVFTEGTVAGKRVRCLSADVQLLFHTLFDLNVPHVHDVTLLREELGASVPDGRPTEE